MTYNDALTLAISNLTDTAPEVAKTLTNLQASLVKRATRTPAEKAKANAARREKTAAARETIVAAISPIVLAAMSDEPRTAADIFGRCAADLPEGFTVGKVQYLLLHELAEQVVRTEAKGKPNLYALRVEE